MVGPLPGAGEIGEVPKEARELLTGWRVAMTDALDRLRAALADRYAIEREIGSGGMATVVLPWLAHGVAEMRFWSVLGPFS